LKKWFSPLNHQNPQVLKRRSIEKNKERERKRTKKYWKKRERKAPRISWDKREVNILRGKHFNFKNPFYMMPFCPPPSYHFKNVFHIIEKVFVTLFGPSFSLAIYMTWVVPILLTHELHMPIEGRMRRNSCWAKVRNHIPKRVPEWLMLRYRSIIFSSIDVKEVAK
jgi:hypothetical protein